MGRLTDDPNDPELTHGVDNLPVPQAPAYLVLSEEERAKGFIRPLRRSYVHLVCGVQTTMVLAIAETCARNPQFYGATYCIRCARHLPIAEFVWSEPFPDAPSGTQSVVGS